MRSFIKIFLVLLICFDVCAQEQMVILDKNQPAPFKGILSNADQMKKFRESHESLKICKEISNKQEQLAKLTEIESNYYKKKYTNLNDEHEKYKSKTWWQKTGYFLLGVVITGTISYAAMKYGRR